MQLQRKLVGIYASHYLVKVRFNKIITLDFFCVELYSCTVENDTLQLYELFFFPQNESF